MTETLRGRCRCGALSFETSADPLWVAHCHCADCRASTGAAFSTYVGLPSDAVDIAGARASFASSPGVTRSFCSTYGTPFAYEGERWPNELHVFAGIFETPERLTPQAHVYTRDQLPWVHLADELPRKETISG